MASESQLEAYLRKRVEALGGLCWKWVSPGRIGVPDRIVMFDWGVICFVEMKAPGQKERASQFATQHKLRSRGFVVFSSVDSKEKVDQLVTWCMFARVKARTERQRLSDLHRMEDDLK